MLAGGPPGLGPGGAWPRCSLLLLLSGKSSRGAWQMCAWFVWVWVLVFAFLPSFLVLLHTGKANKYNLKFCKSRETWLLGVSVTHGKITSL